MVFPSFYEMSNPLTTVRKQHFWDWFSGDTLNSRWRENDIAGTLVRGMVNEVGGGYKLSAPATAYARGSIDFDQTATDVGKVRQFNSDGSVVIMVLKHITGSSANALTECGLITGTDYHGNGTSRSAISLTETVTSYFHGNGATSPNNTNLTLTPDGNFHTYKIVNTGTTNTCSVDGVLSGNGFASTSSNIPTSSKMQPNFYVYNGNASPTGTSSAQIRYFEAYNT